MSDQIVHNADTSIKYRNLWIGTKGTIANLVKASNEMSDQAQKHAAELEALNRRLTERWEGAKLRYAEDSQRIEELEAENQTLRDDKASQYAQYRHNLADIKAKHTALNTEYNRLWSEITTLEDGLRELLTSFKAELAPEWILMDIRALLGKESEE